MYVWNIFGRKEAIEGAPKAKISQIEFAATEKRLLRMASGHLGMHFPSELLQRGERGLGPNGVTVSYTDKHGKGHMWHRPLPRTLWLMMTDLE